MKDNILNAALIAVAFAMIAASGIDNRGTAPQAATAQVSRVVIMEKTVVAAKRLPLDVASVTAHVTLVSSAER